MATVPRPILTPNTPTVIGGRAAAGMRNIANVSGAPVNELNEGGGVQAESFAQQFHDFAYGYGYEHPPNQHFAPNGRPRMDFGSGMDFIASFEARDSDAADSEFTGSGGSSKFLHRLSFVTGIYERNSKEGLEETAPRGETYNFNL